MLPSDQTLEPSLVRKLLLRRHPDQRYGNDAVVAATELLRLFIVEARQRAAIEVRWAASVLEELFVSRGRAIGQILQVSIPSIVNYLAAGKVHPVYNWFSFLYSL